MSINWKILLSWVLGAVISPLCAAALFEDQAPLEIELTGPLSSLIDNKENRKEQPFQLRSEGNQLDILIRARGNSRMRVCDFPPLRFNFGKADTAGTPFEGLRKLKLVNRCKKEERYEYDVLEEYAAYRIFSLLSDAGFRTRLVRLTYNDTDGRLKAAYRHSYGFLLEPLDQLVTRMHGTRSRLSSVSLRQLDKEQAALVYVFQYLIANTDWSFVTAENDDYCCHNIELIKTDQVHVPVPYDFDLAGMVNAAYARPDPSLKIKNVSRRIYRGFCTDSTILRAALRRITSKEEEILGIIAGLPLLKERTRENRIKYLKGFFDMAVDEDKLIAMFEKRCHP